MSEFYNEVIKNKYLDSIENEGSRNTIKYVFLASKSTETIKEMDLYNFSKEDIELVMKNISPKTYNGARSNALYISHYISWCIKNGYRENNLNPLDVIDRKWYSKFIDRTTKMHYSYEEFLDLVNDKQMLNYQDKAFLFLIFEGILGEQFSELRELKYDDINFELGEIYIKERNQTINVSKECIDIVEKACNERTFYYYNRKTDDFNDKELLQSNYVFKNVKSPRTSEGEMITPAVFYTRLNVIKNVMFSLDYLTPKSIWQSGMLYMCAQLFLRDGEIDTKQFKEIASKYNFPTITNGEYTYPNTTLMKNFITRENLKELYDLDVPGLEVREVKRK